MSTWILIVIAMGGYSDSDYELIPVHTGDLRALMAELEAKDKRILELDYLRLSACEVFKEIGNELGCNPGNESIMMAIDALKERLATPVRLPNKSDDEFWFDGVFQVAKFDRAVERAISAAGFKFVGDE